MSTRGRFTPEQVERLLRPIKRQRVYQANGQSHVAGWDITAHLTRMFGFGGWEKEILALDLVAEDSAEVAKNGKSRLGWWVTYRCVMRLRVFDPDGRLAVQIDDVATGTAQNMPARGDAHDFAVKNAVTYALKRCAKDLGDQFGLSLYNKGYEGAVVGMTLVGAPEAPSAEDEPEVAVEGEGDDHEPPEVPADQPEQEAIGTPADDTPAVETVAAEVAQSWLDLMNTVEDKVVRKGVKNRFVREFGKPHDVPAGSESVVEEWLTNEIARVTGPIDTRLTDEERAAQEAALLDSSEF